MHYILFQGVCGKKNMRERKQIDGSQQHVSRPIQSHFYIIQISHAACVISTHCIWIPGPYRTLYLLLITVGILVVGIKHTVQVHR